MSNPEVEFIEDKSEFDKQLYLWATTTAAGKDAKAKLTIGFINEKLRFFKIYSSSIGNIGDASSIKEPIYDQWESYLNDYRNEAPSQMKSVTQNAGEYWAWIAREQGFVQSAK